MGSAVQGNEVMRLKSVILIFAVLVPGVIRGELQPVVVPGDLVPLRDGLQSFVAAERAALNNRGDIVLFGQAENGMDAIWYRPANGSLSLVSQEGDWVPGTIDGTRFVHEDDETTIDLNQRNEIWWSTIVEGDSRGEQSMWLASPHATLRLIHQTGDSAIGYPIGNYYSDADSITFTNRGVAISSYVRNPETDSGGYGIYWWQHDQLKLLMKAGDRRPGQDAEQIFQTPEHTTANQHGVVVVTDLGARRDATSPVGLWVYAADGREPRDVLNGQSSQLFPVPPDSLWASYISDDETVYFSAKSFENGFQGFWKADRQGAEPIVMTGDELGEGVVTHALHLKANQNGNVAYGVRWQEDRRRIGIWREVDGVPQMLAANGMIAPETEERFDQVGARFEQNERGKIAFEANLAPGDARGIWAEDATGTLRMIVRDDSLIELGNGTVQRVETVDLDGFNDAGQILIRVRFEDKSSGFLISDEVAYPIGGDYNFDGVIDLQDIDAQSLAGRELLANVTFDENGDDLINDLDRAIWVRDHVGTWFGDANFDLAFDSADLVKVFQGGEYEDQVPLNSVWSSGDWNGDGDFTTEDLTVAFIDGGYERGRRAELLAVPEPSVCSWLWAWLVILVHRYFRRVSVSSQIS